MVFGFQNAKLSFVKIYYSVNALISLVSMSSYTRMGAMVNAGIKAPPALDAATTVETTLDGIHFTLNPVTMYCS